MHEWAQLRLILKKHHLSPTQTVDLQFYRLNTWLLFKPLNVGAIWYTAKTNKCTEQSNWKSSDMRIYLLFYRPCLVSCSSLFKFYFYFFGLVVWYIHRSDSICPIVSTTVTSSIHIWTLSSLFQIVFPIENFKIILRYQRILGKNCSGSNVYYSL